MRVPDIELQELKDPGLLEFMDYVRIILNDGRYQLRTVSDVPVWTGIEGEMVLYAAGTERGIYYYLNGQWNASLFAPITGNTLIHIGTSDDNSIYGDATNGLWVGAPTYATAPFKVSLAGAMIATSATITGSITANTGQIGGWSISSNLLYTGSGATFVALDSGPYPIYIGSTNPLDAAFYVTNTGVVTCTAIKLSGLQSGSSIDGTYIQVGSVLADKLNVTELSAISAAIGTITSGIVTAATIQTSANPAVNRVRMDANGLIGYDDVLGQTFKIPTDGSAPTFASGQIISATIIGTTIISSSYKSSSELPWVEITSAGLAYRETISTALYGSGVKYGSGTKYGVGVVMYIGNSAKPVISVEAERALADLRLYNRSDLPSGAAVIGDFCVEDGIPNFCTVAGTPGTWAEFVLASTNQTVAGIKTFSSFPITPSSAPTTDYQVVNKKHVDDTVAATRVKAWVNFQGTGTIAINDSYNVSSITDNGSGDYTVVWDTDFANANYAVVAISTTGQTYLAIVAAGSVRIYTTDALGNVADASIVCVIAIGDQA